MIVSTLDDTTRFAERVARALHPGSTVALCGPLGSGKTTLTRDVVRALGGLDPVSSPTFVLEHEYRTTSGVVMRHWDVYRLGEPPLELIEPPAPNEIRLIEWADKFPALVTAADLTVAFRVSFDGDTPIRSVEVTGRLAPSLAAPV